MAKDKYLLCQVKMLHSHIKQEPYNSGVCEPSRVLCHCDVYPVKCTVISSLSTDIDDRETLLEHIDAQCLKYCPKRQIIGRKQNASRSLV